ncbi:hypothetical protein HYH02_007977 [Chlamydomonas schloesseri]|uniref:3'-5' exonuclease domain-containing protein n=1 Tax=Chlamydomonas schloesseri TaxID=2026947 RepID=A0A835WGS4_9CHLO|nr:hypothetical protein HYH02_007977 [Chlamydomonas schloesseri]|eukprot:KAG2447237.1 hypothetical protein HYH02_007977 [Chlamydomonas schloesseri]
MYHHHGLGQGHQQGQHGGGPGAPAQFATSDSLAVGPAGVTTTYIQVPQQQAVLLGPGTVFGVAGPGGFTVFPTSAGLLPAGVYASPHVSQLPQGAYPAAAGGGLGSVPQLIGGAAMSYGAHPPHHMQHIQQQHMQQLQQQQQQQSLQARAGHPHHPHSQAVGGQQPLPLPQRRPGMRPQQHQSFDSAAARPGGTYLGSAGAVVTGPIVHAGNPGPYHHQHLVHSPAPGSSVMAVGGPGSRGQASASAGQGAPAYARAVGSAGAARTGPPSGGGGVYGSPPAADTASAEGLEGASVEEPQPPPSTAEGSSQGGGGGSSGAATGAAVSPGGGNPSAGSSSAAAGSAPAATGVRSGGAPQQSLGSAAGGAFQQQRGPAVPGAAAAPEAAAGVAVERPAGVAGAGTLLSGTISNLDMSDSAAHGLHQQQHHQHQHPQQHPQQPSGPGAWAAGGGAAVAAGSSGGPAGVVRPFPVGMLVGVGPGGAPHAVVGGGAFGDANASAGMAGLNLAPVGLAAVGHGGLMGHGGRTVGAGGGGPGGGGGGGLPDHGGATAMRAMINWRATFGSSLQPYDVLPPDHPGKATEGLSELRLGPLEVLVAETPDAANVAVEALRSRMWDGVLAMATVERNDEADPIALLQLSAAGLALVVRPAVCGGLPAAFRTAVVEDSDIELVVASWNSSDERNFEESFGLQTFWCQITELPKVAKASGYSKIGIKALVQAVLEPAAAMPKSKKMASYDWSSPKLPPEIIKQAVLDVACIEHVFRCLDGRF